MNEGKKKEFINMHLSVHVDFNLLLFIRFPTSVSVPGPLKKEFTVFATTLQSSELSCIAPCHVSNQNTQPNPDKRNIQPCFL